MSARMHDIMSRCASGGECRQPVDYLIVAGHFRSIFLLLSVRNFVLVIEDKAIEHHVE